MPSLEDLILGITELLKGYVFEPLGEIGLWAFAWGIYAPAFFLLIIGVAMIAFLALSQDY